jgi:protease I
VTVDRALDAAGVGDYDALLLPGGVTNPDRLRTIPKAVELVKQFFDEGKPIAVICHGAWTLIEAGVVRGVKMTSWPSVKTDLVNAGAHWVDLDVVADRGIVSSRKPDDIPAFNRKMIEEFGESAPEGAGTRQPAA